MNRHLEILISCTKDSYLAPFILEEDRERECFGKLRRVDIGNEISDLHRHKNDG